MPTPPSTSAARADATTLRRESPGELPPIVIADALLAMILGEQATRASIQVGAEPAASSHTFELHRRGVVVEAFELDDDRTAAVVARLACAAGLDPLVEVGSARAATNVARLRASDGQRSGEILVTIAASSRGFHVELRALSVDGREPGVQRRDALRRCAVCARFAAAHESTCREDGGRLDPVPESPHPGGTIGPWLVGRALGEGGMGVVHAAEHALLGRQAAVKIMRRSVTRSRALTDRFLVEARAASRLEHPNVVNVSDFGVLEDGRPYFVMERLHGESLADRLHREGPLDPAFALRIAREIAEALAAAHRSGVVHHDLKPSNVMLLDGTTEDAPRVKLVDFGAAAIGERSLDPNVVYGTPRYMSPERARGEPGDARSDLYGLGVVLFEMLAGAPPFLGDGGTEVLLAHLASPPPPLEPPSGALPPAATRLVQRALEKSPSERHQTADEMIVELSRAIAAVERPEWKRWLP